MSYYMKHARDKVNTQEVIAVTAYPLTLGPQHFPREVFPVVPKSKTPPGIITTPCMYLLAQFEVIDMCDYWINFPRLFC